MQAQKAEGTRDLIGAEMRAWQKMQQIAASVFEPFGFKPIETPAIEQVDVFVHGIGQSTDVVRKEMFRVFSGANLERVFTEGTDTKLKPKQRLALRPEGTAGVVRAVVENNLVPQGSTPFKAYYAEAMFRGERPQKGRLREFVQCDIDILGSDSPLCELELIHTTAAALLKLHIGAFTIKVNDRRVLRGVLSNLGVPQEMMDSICISLDKWDKIGTEGVLKELEEKQLNESARQKLAELLDGGCTIEQAKQLCPEPQYIEQLQNLIASAKELADGKYDVVFDLLLIRGQGYYTGTVFEIQSNQYRGALGGGGRYDGLVGKFTGENVPAVGFSIGFERIFQILEEQGFAIPNRRKKAAVLCEEAQGAQAIRTCDALRAQGIDASVYLRPKKMGKFLNRLQEQGYDGFLVLGESEEPKWFEN